MISKKLLGECIEFILPVLVNSELNLTQTSVMRAKNKIEQMMTLKILVQTKIVMDFINFPKPKFLFAMFDVNKISKFKALFNIQFKM
jgi:hypothetical protein